MACSLTVPNHYMYLNKRWQIVDCTLGYKLRWNLNQITIILTQLTDLKMLAAKWRPFCSCLNVTFLCVYKVYLQATETPTPATWPHRTCITLSSWWRHQMETYWPFVQGIHRSPLNSPHKGQWHGALMFSLICAWISGWVNNREAGDLRRQRAHYDVIVMLVFARSRIPILSRSFAYRFYLMYTI